MIMDLNLLEANFNISLNKNDIEAKPSSKRKPQFNAILKRIHQTIGNMVPTFEVENRPIDENDPWSGILSALAWAVPSTYHITLHSTPGQLGFGQDMILDVAHDFGCSSCH
jgi:hypothetical protein